MILFPKKKLTSGLMQLLVCGKIFLLGAVSCCVLLAGCEEVAIDESRERLARNLESGYPFYINGKFSRKEIEGALKALEEVLKTRGEFVIELSRLKNGSIEVYSSKTMNQNIGSVLILEKASKDNEFLLVSDSGWER